MVQFKRLVKLGQIRLYKHLSREISIYVKIILIENAQEAWEQLSVPRVPVLEEKLATLEKKIKKDEAYISAQTRALFSAKSKIKTKYAATYI